MQETWVRSLGREDPLEKEMATHSSILAWRIPWVEEPGGLQSTGQQRVGHDFTFTFTFNVVTNLQLLEVLFLVVVVFNLEHWLGEYFTSCSDLLIFLSFLPIFPLFSSFFFSLSPNFIYLFFNINLFILIGGQLQYCIGLY